MAILKHKSIIERCKYDVPENELKSFIKEMNEKGYWEPFGEERNSTFSTGDNKTTYHIILEKRNDMCKKDLETKLFNWVVISGSGAIADGSVFANDEFEAIEKVKKKYDSQYLKVEISYGEEEGMEEDKNVNGLYVRWED